MLICLIRNMYVSLHSDSIDCLFNDLRCTQWRNRYSISICQCLPAATTAVVLLCEFTMAHRCNNQRQSLTCFLYTRFAGRVSYHCMQELPILRHCLYAFLPSFVMTFCTFSTASKCTLGITCSENPYQHAQWTLCCLTKGYRCLDDKCTDPLHSSPLTVELFLSQLACTLSR